MAGNASRAIARRLIAKLSPRPSSMRQTRSFRIHREIAALDSMLPFHSTVASARLVSRLSSAGFHRFEGDRRACSSSSFSGGDRKSLEQMSETSEGEEYYDESESEWSHDEGEEGDDGSDPGSEFESDTFLNDNDLWDENEKPEENKNENENTQTPARGMAGKVTREEPSVSDPWMEEIARVLPNVPEDAVKKAADKFRQEHGENARVRKEAGAYLNAMKKEYDSRSLVQDEHCKKVLHKLSLLKPDPDGRYRNLMEVVSDMDILLEAYRRVKAGPGGDPSKVPLDNVNMDWFYETQAKLRNGTFKVSPIKVVEVEKRDLCKIERKRKQFRHFRKKARQPY